MDHKALILDTLCNDEESSQEELESYLADAKGYDVKALLEFWFKYGRRIYLYMQTRKFPGLEKFPSVSFLSAGNYLSCLVDAFQLK